MGLLTAEIHCGIVIGDDDMPLPEFEYEWEFPIPFVPTEGMVLKFGRGVDERVELGVGHVEYDVPSGKLSLYAGVSVETEKDAKAVAKQLRDAGWMRVEE